MSERGAKLVLTFLGGVQLRRLQLRLESRSWLIVVIHLLWRVF